MSSWIRCRVPTLIGSLVVLLLGPACGKDTLSPEDPGCMVEPTSLDLGAVLTFPGDSPDTIDVAITVHSLVIINSTGGTSPLTGQVSVAMQSTAAHPPRVVLLPEGRDPHFVLPARSSETFRFKVIYDPTTSPGLHQGQLAFGPPCAAVPFSIEVTVAAEPKPVFVDEWGEPGTGPGQYRTPSSLAMGNAHTLYIADQVNNRVQLLNRTGQVLGEWRQWDEHDMDQGLTQSFLPAGVAVGPDGDVYLADTEYEHGRKRITRFTADGEFVKRWGPVRTGGSIFTDPFHLAVASDGTIFSVDSGARVVRAFVLDQSSEGYQVVAEWGGSDLFGVPHGIALGDSGWVYVSDQSRNRIHRFDREGNETLSWGALGEEIGQFRSPLGIAVDGAGEVYVADSGNSRVQKFTSDGTFITTWGDPGADIGQMDKPNDVEVDENGMIYVLDQSRDRILRFQPAQSVP